MSDNILLDRLMTVACECRKINHNLPNNIESSLKNFEKVLLKSSDAQKAWLKDMYGSELNRIHFTVIKIPSLRSLNNKIFNKYFPPQYVTKLFERFIRGITYFGNEKQKATPIYHRLYSCGPYENTHREGNLICYYVLNGKEIKRRRSIIERCYIERLIYNELYIKLSLNFPKQDVGHVNHLFRLDLTKKDFETCFPNTTISVSLEYQDNIPIILTITKNNNGNIVTLIYKKTFTITSYGSKEYDDIVEVIKTEDNNKYFKTSTFRNPGKFIKLSSH